VTFGKGTLTSKDAVGGKNTTASSEPVDSIFIISFLDRMIQFDVLDLRDIHRVCHMTFH